MARNGSGTMSPLSTVSNGTTIDAPTHNALVSDICSEITNSVAKDGQTTLTGQFKAANGTVAAPGISFGSDIDTGLYRIGGDNVGFACAGAKVLDISATGLAVTGTVVPSTAIAVANGGTGAATATAAYNALAPTTTRGDITKRGATNNERLAVGAAGKILVSDGTDPSWGDLTDATVTYAKLASAATATQSDQETGTSTTTIVTPGRQHFHDSAAKCWTITDVAGNRQDFYNVSSVTDGGVGLMTASIGTDFSSAEWVASALAQHSNTLVTFVSSQTAGAATVATVNLSNSATDPTRFNVAGHGDI